MMLALASAVVGLVCPPETAPSISSPAGPTDVVVGNPVIRTVQLNEFAQPAAPNAEQSRTIKVTDCTPANPLVPSSLAAVKVSLEASATFEKLFEVVGSKLADTPVDVDWKRLEEMKIARTTPIGIKISDLPLGDAFKLINEKLDAPMDDFACAISHGVLSVTTLNTLDRDRLLKIYDVRDLVSAEADARKCTREAALVAITDAITQAVNPEDWADMGGEKARWQHVSGSLVITAPPRFQTQIECLLNAMRKAAEAKPA